jgi:predicted nucleic acid-binding protein
VLDASVALKWVLTGEPYDKEADKLKEAVLSGVVRLCAPSLLLHEVANSLWKATKRKRITQAHAYEALKSFDDIQIILQEITSEQAAEELRIASELDIAAYDASYLFLSKKMKAPLITADDVLCEKAKAVFEVIQLRDYV